MRRRLAAGTGYCVLVAAGLLLACGPALAQREGMGPALPVGPQLPTLQRRPPPPPPPPFVLTPQQQAEVDRLLDAWERRGNEVRTFECPFTRWDYDATFRPEKPTADNPYGAKYVNHGTIIYTAPDKGFFKSDGYLTENHKVEQHEQWICDGKSVFNYDWATSVLTEYQLPREAQGKAIVDGPLPFLFGAGAEKLRQRYYIHLITPSDVRDAIWLEAFPRYQRAAGNFQSAQLILKAKDLAPSAMQIYYPGGKDRRAYKFDNVVVNGPRKFFGLVDPYHASTPPIWEKVVKPPEPPAEARRVP